MWFLNVLLATGKKAITRNWPTQDSPNLNAGMEITMSVYKYEMEKITSWSTITGSVHYILGKMD